MDVFVKDSSRVLDLEMQTGNYDDLLLRARFYQGSADVSMVPRRTKYRELKESFIVFICKEDPFGLGVPKYTKKSIFEESDSLSYDDKTHIVFYNASAYEKENNLEIKNVLRFIYNSKAESEFTKEVQNSVTDTKSREVMRGDYMTVQDIIDEEVEKATEKGKQLGKAEGVTEGKKAGLAEGILKTAKAMLKENCNIKFISKITGLSEEEIKKL